jgi:hypothetical protein
MIFYSEGNPTCLLVTKNGGIRKRPKMKFSTAELALARCRENGSNLFYTAHRLKVNNAPKIPTDQTASPRWTANAAALCQHGLELNISSSAFVWPFLLNSTFVCH